MRKIPIKELRPGMKVLSIDMPWLLQPTVYATEGVIESIDHIAKIIADGFTETFIDDGSDTDGTGSKDLDEVLYSSEQPSLQLDTLTGLTPTTAIEKELPAAKDIYEHAMSFATRATALVTRPCGTLSMDEAEKVVDEMVNSMARNHNAFMGIIKLRPRDEYVYTHSVNVAAMAILFARHLGFSNDRVHRIGVAGLLHDIGKSFVPDEILHSPRRLNPEQFAIMKRHPELGYRQIHNIEGLYEEIPQAILEHHERWDGRGYPKGLKGEEISVVGRIMGIIDTYDAMTSSRVFKDSMPPYRALAMLYSMRNESFQVELLEQFIRSQGIYPVGSIVELDSGWRGVVVESCPLKPLCPKVVLLKDPSGRGVYSRIIDLAAQDANDSIRQVLSASQSGINPAMALSLR
jgi:putative nucleotidyltransferase with HDIG domain